MNILVTEDGRVQNLDTGNWLKGEVNNCNYLRIWYKKKRYFVHRLVAMHHLPNPEGKSQVNHIDGNKQNNHVSNLEWATPEENQQHRYYVLKKNLGEDSSNAKATEEIVLEIRKRYEEESITMKTLSIEYDLSPTLIRRIIRRIAWKHI